jgi:hypothetical protein
MIWTTVESVLDSGQWNYICFFRNILPAVDVTQPLLRYIRQLLYRVKEAVP